MTMRGSNTLLHTSDYYARVQEQSHRHQMEKRPLQTQKEWIFPPLLDKPIVLNDGTLYFDRSAHMKSHPCHYFADFRRQPQEIPPRPITKIHYHFEDCYETQLGNRLGQHYQAYLLARTAQIPYQLTCGKFQQTNPIPQQQQQHQQQQHQQQQHNNNTIESNNTSISNVFSADTKEMLFPPSHNRKLHPELKKPQESVLKHLSLLHQFQGETSTLPRPVDPYGGQEWLPHHVCHHCPGAAWACHLGLNLVADQIIQDMRQLAASVVQTMQPTDDDAGFQPDDIVIHLRLGDALKGHHDEHIGLLPHRTYTGLIQKAIGEMKKQNVTTPMIRSIGIVTQSFDKANVRAFDRSDETLHKSKAVADDLVAFLQEVFPHVPTIQIHNEEPPLLSFARLTTARIASICGASTFCTLPVLATLGPARGYLFRGEKHSPWAVHTILQHPERLESFKVPRLANHVIDKLTVEDILHWLRNQLPIGEEIIDKAPIIRNSPSVKREDEKIIVDGGLSGSIRG